MYKNSKEERREREKETLNDIIREWKGERKCTRIQRRRGERERKKL